jgi:HAD superfamily hydrolase (TIGR01509 family)
VNDRTAGHAAVNARAVDVLLCDADGNLFPSEDPAFEASTVVTNRALSDLGIDRSFVADDLRNWALGRNFRSTLSDLAAEAGVVIEPADLQRWVLEERNAVVSHLRCVLKPDREVLEPLQALGRRFALAVVSSSASARIDACLAATGLDEHFAPEARFSAEDSLPTPTSKPDPAVYALAGERLGVSGGAGLAVEDAVAGVRSAVAAGFPTVGNLEFVARGERADRSTQLREAGVCAIVSSWRELGRLLEVDVPLVTA